MELVNTHTHTHNCQHMSNNIIAPIASPHFRLPRPASPNDCPTWWTSCEFIRLAYAMFRSALLCNVPGGIMVGKPRAAPTVVPPGRIRTHLEFIMMNFKFPRPIALSRSALRFGYSIHSQSLFSKVAIWIFHPLSKSDLKVVSQRLRFGFSTHSQSLISKSFLEGCDLDFPPTLNV